MSSLEKKLLAGLSLVLVIAFGIILLFSVFAVRNLGEAYILTRLEHDAEALLGSLTKTATGDIELSDSRITPIYQQPFSGHYYRFDFVNGDRIDSRSIWDYTLITQTLTPGNFATYNSEGPNKQHLLVRSAGYSKHGFDFTLTVAEDLQAVESQIHRYQFTALLVLLMAAILLTLFQRYILRKGFNELDKVRHEISLIANGRLQRLNEAGPDEIRPVIIEINRLLGQLEQRLKRSRVALGNLAHALKSPISLMTHEIDRMTNDQRQKQLLAQNLERIHELIERELKRARFGKGDAGRYFNPARDIPELVDALTRIHQDKAVSIRHNLLPTENLPVDQEDMIELLGNLLDNACKWAEQSVFLKISSGDRLDFTIRDDGPGVSETQIHEMTTRGKRIDEEKPGSGLGLSIVRDIVDDYAGSILFENANTPQGLVIRISLPLPVTHPAPSNRYN